MLIRRIERFLREFDVMRHLITLGKGAGFGVIDRDEVGRKRLIAAGPVLTPRPVSHRGLSGAGSRLRTPERPCETFQPAETRWEVPVRG